MKTKLLLFLFFFSIQTILLSAQTPAASNVWTADNGNGTYKNPLLWGDWPDPDLIRVGDDFYFVSTSMHYVPGCPILHSKDLVNWEMTGYAVDTYDEDPRYNMQGGEMYLRGSWASTIRYHNGLFYVGFCTPNWDKEKGHFSICTAKDVKGPWTRTIFPEYLYDPGLFFDDDGKVYVAHGQQKLFITELNADALSVKTPQKEIYNNRDYPYLEGSHLYKINGKYYILGSSGGTKGREVCLRSDNIYGPYESKIVIHDDNGYPKNFLHQGGMVQLKDGSWWFMIMQDRGAIGRTPNLEPVTWVDGWPMLGAAGKGVTTYKKPNVGKTYPVKFPATSDEFNQQPSLGLQWQWNHNPDNEKWSLTQRKGYMRLHASYASDVTMARNTLTQRIQGPASEGTVELDASGLKDGNVAGFGIFQSPYAYIAVRKEGAEKTLVMVNNGQVVDSINNFAPNKIWLKANATHIGFTASFSYSEDGKNFIPFGNQLNMALGYDWTANRFALLNFSTKKEGEGGAADFNWFHFKGENNYSAHNDISYNSNSLKIGGKDVFIYSAAFHYFRCPKELWRDRFQKIKDAGFNTVESYIPWNWHERNMPKNINDQSQFNFADLKEWLDMAQNEFGLYTIVRPGPFICAEWAGGGYPRWLAKFRPGVKDFWLRSSDREYLKWSEHWYDAVCKFIAGEQVTNKKLGEKGIIMVQIENEYDSHDNNNKIPYLQTLYTAVRKAGVNVPVFTCLTSQCRNSSDSILKNVFDCDNYYVDLNDAISCAKRMNDLKQQQPNAPGFVTELQGGWFSTVTGRLSEEHYSDAKHFYAVGMMSILGGATGLNYYMIYGGTHFAGWGARGQTTSYDYNAAIRENGSLSKKYYAAKNLGDFIKKYQQQLIHSKGGICMFENAPKEIVGGIRIAADGTKFVFLHNSSEKKKLSGTVLVKPGEDVALEKPMYNVDQNEKKVLITADAKTKNDLAAQPSFEINYELDSLETKVLIIAPKSLPDKGLWWKLSDQPAIPKRLANTDQSVRIATVLRHDEDFKADWKKLPASVSLPELGVNDCRYTLYRSQFSLNENDIQLFSKLLFNTFSRDILNVQVNGKIAVRIYPAEKWAAQVWRDVNKSFKQITDNDYDNRFDINGLLQKGNNEIVVVYENIGHEHGYFPMEELCGIKKAGLSANDSILQKQLRWQVATNLAGIREGYIDTQLETSTWKAIQLDTTFTVLRKGNNIQPKAKQDALFTWYRASFELPENADGTNTWRLLINASGNGYIYLNGHNIGRHWEQGPQREYYLPECWLQFGKNKKNMITLGLRQTINGAVIKGMEIKPY